MIEIETELQLKEEEIESLNRDLETRNDIIDNISKQLAENDMQLIEKTSIADNLQTEIEQTTMKLKNKENDMQQLQKELENRHKDLEFRN